MKLSEFGHVETLNPPLWAIQGPRTGQLVKVELCPCGDLVGVDDKGIIWGDRCGQTAYEILRSLQEE